MALKKKQPNDGERLQTCIENVTGRFEGKIKINVLKTNIKGPFQQGKLKKESQS